jgi:hypothetical protein
MGRQERPGLKICSSPAGWPPHKNKSAFPGAWPPTSPCYLSGAEALWRSCSGDIAAQSDLFRLTYATEVLKDDVWGSRVMGTKEWLAGDTPDFAQKNGFRVEKRR